MSFAIVNRVGHSIDRSLKYRLAAVLLGAGLVLPAAGCGEDGSKGRQASLDLVPITDIDPRSDVVEVNLVAAPGRTSYLADGPAEVWGYKDGSRTGSTVAVPGPVIEANLGDTIVVRFSNDLPEGTTIHWHGMRVPNMADGTPSTQMEVPSGGTFEYRFVATDVGTFWYHPHVRGDVQVERGLYGAIIVRDLAAPKVDADRTFVLDDVKLEATGRLSEKTEPLDLMLGRQGNVVLANGRVRGRVETKAGARERWRFINSANGRYFNLQLPGRVFTVIGWDGGLVPQPYGAETLLISPGERYEVIVHLDGAPGDTFTLETIHYDRGHNVPDPGPKPVFDITLKERVASPLPLPATSGPMAALTVVATTPVRSLVLTEQDPTAPGEEPRFFINAVSFPDVPPILGNVGDVEIWNVKNDSEMDHPFHLHGMFFVVLDVDGIPPQNLGWKDTVNIPRGQTLRFAVRYGDPGTWMYHCHILEHAERGMMAELVLSARN